MMCFGVPSIDGVDQRGERRRLTRTGRAADQHQAAAETRQPLDLGRQIELGERRHARGQNADRRRGTPALVMQVDPEAAERRHAQRGVGNAVLLKLPRRVRRQHRHDDRLDVFAIEREIGDRRQQAVNAHHRRPAGNQQQIAAFAAHHFRQPLIDAARRPRAGDRRRTRWRSTHRSAHRDHRSASMPSRSARGLRGHAHVIASPRTPTSVRRPSARAACRHAPG